MLASVYGRLEDHKASVEVWQRFLEIDPGNFEANVQLGTHQLALGESEKAAAALKKALELQPSSARAYQSLGEVWARDQPGRRSCISARRSRSARQHSHAPDARRRAAARNGRRRRPRPGVLAADQNRFGLDPGSRLTASRTRRRQQTVDTCWLKAPGTSRPPT
jgi:tetratricopeptide (TPR) repeat protein